MSQWIFLTLKMIELWVPVSAFYCMCMEDVDARTIHKEAVVLRILSTIRKSMSCADYGRMLTLLRKQLSHAWDTRGIFTREYEAPNQQTKDCLLSLILRVRVQVVTLRRQAFRSGNKNGDWWWSTPWRPTECKFHLDIRPRGPDAGNPRQADEIEIHISTSKMKAMAAP